MPQPRTPTTDGSALVDQGRLRAILDSLLDPHVLLTAIRDDDGVIVDFLFADANPAACSFNLRTYDDLVGQRLLELHPAAGPTGLLAMYAHVVESGEPLVLDDWSYPQDMMGGLVRHYDVRCVPVADGLTQTWRDVTERYQTQEALRRSEDAFRMLAENATDIVYRTGPDRRIMWVSPNIVNALGWTVDEVLGHAITDFMHADDIATSAEMRSALYAGTAKLEDHTPTPLFRLRGRDGSYRWMAAHGTTVLDETGHFDGLMFGVHDVDDLVRARADEERTRISMDVASIGMALASPAGVLLHVNPAMARMLDCEPADLEGRTFGDITHPDDLAAGLAAVRDLAAGVRDSFTQRKRYLRRSGEPIWVDLSVAAARDADGSVLHFVAQLVDVDAEVRNLQSLQAALRQFRDLAEHASDVVYRTGPDGIVEWISPSVTRVLGWSPEELVGRLSLDFVSPHDLDEAQSMRSRLFVEATPGRVVHRLRTAAGGYRQMSVLATPLTDPDGTVTGAVFGLRDVTDEEEARAAFRSSEERMRVAMEAAPAGMAFADQDGRLIDVNPALCAMLGQPADALIGRPLADLLTPEDRVLVDQLTAGAPGGGPRTIRHEHYLASPGRLLWVVHAVSLLPRNGSEAPMFVHQFVDQTEAHGLQEDLAHRASHDALTGVSNRGDLLEQLDSSLGLHLGAPGQVGLLFCDIDNLKPINDAYGHPCGDAVITAVADRLVHGVRQGDTVGRVGGDEFVVILRAISGTDELARVAAKLQAEVSCPVRAGDQLVDLTLSVGAVMARSEEEVHTLLARADTALYRAKRAGRNRVVVADPG